MHVDSSSALATNRATDDIDDAENPTALAFDLLYRREGLERLAGLADGDVEGVAFDNGITVAKFGRSLGMSRQSRQLLDQVGTQRSGYVCRTATENLDPPDVEKLAGAQLDAPEMRRLETRLQPAAQGTAHRVGLLSDLLAHVVGEFALLERPGRPLDHRGHFCGGPTVEGRGLEPIGTH